MLNICGRWLSSNSNSYLGPKYLKRWYASIQKQIPDISDEEVYEDFKLFVAEEAPEWFKTKSPESQRAWFQKKVLSYDRWEMLSEDDFKEKLDLENDEVLKNASEHTAQQRTMRSFQIIGHNTTKTYLSTYECIGVV